MYILPKNQYRINIAENAVIVVRQLCRAVNRAAAKDADFTAERHPLTERPIKLQPSMKNAEKCRFYGVILFSAKKYRTKKFNFTQSAKITAAAQNCAAADM